MTRATGDEKDSLERIKALLQRLATDLGLPRKATDSLSSMPPWKLATLIQTAIEQLRVERHQAVSLAGRVDALMSDLTDVVRGLPLGAIQGNDEQGALIAIRKIYRGPDSNPPTIEPATPSAVAEDVNRVLDALAALGRTPATIRTAAALADRIETRAIDENQLGDVLTRVQNTLALNDTARIWIENAIGALGELVISLRFGLIRPRRSSDRDALPRSRWSGIPLR